MPTHRPSRITLLAAAGLASISALSSSSQAAITFYDIFYSRILSQSIPDMPPTNAPRFLFSAGLRTNDALDLLQCTLSVPGRGPRFLAEFNEGEYLFFSPTEYFSEASLAFDFPAGTYSHNISGGLLGNLSGSIQRPATLLWPGELPYFTGDTLTRFDLVNPSQDLVVTVNDWDPVPGTNVSVTFFVVYDNGTGAEVFTAQVPSTQGTLVVPAGSLAPDTDFTVEVIFTSRISNPNAGFGTATRTVGFDYRTSASLRTGAAVTCLVDFNNDGFLNQEDLQGYITAFLDESVPTGPSGTSTAPCPGEPNPYNELGYAADFNRDCSFNQEDLGGFVTEYFLQAENPVGCVPG